MKIGIFGGAFSPPHKTHVKIVNSALKQLKLDKIFVLPTGDSPHKLGTASSVHRLKMTRLAFEHLKKVEVSSFEVEKEGTSYSYLTVEHFKRLYPHDDLFFVIGADSLRDFKTWKNPHRIASNCSLVAVGRVGVDVEQHAKIVEKDYSTKVYLLNTEVDDVSSTEQRLRFQFGLPIKDVPEKVVDYVFENGLYSDQRKLTELLKTKLSQKKYMHSFYTTKAGLKINKTENPNRVFVACALHDCAKECKNYEKYGFVVPNDMPESVVHAFFGKVIAQVEFGVLDEEILSAIQFHTTAKPNMSPLEKIVYVADKIEETRPYPTEHLKKTTLDETFVEVLKEAHAVCVQRGNEVYPLTERAIEFYVKGESYEG